MRGEQHEKSYADLVLNRQWHFDKVQDYEFTRKAAQRFRQVVSWTASRMKMLT